MIYVMCVLCKDGIAYLWRNWKTCRMMYNLDIEKISKHHRSVIYQIFRQISVSGQTWFHAMSRPWSGVPRTITACFPVSKDMRCRGAKGKVHPFGRIHNDLYLPFIAHQALTHDFFAIFYPTTLTANFKAPTLQASTRTDYSHSLSISFLTNTCIVKLPTREISTFDRFTIWPVSPRNWIWTWDWQLWGLWNGWWRGKWNQLAKHCSNFTTPQCCPGPFRDPLTGRARPSTVRTTWQDVILVGSDMLQGNLHDPNFLKLKTEVQKHTLRTCW